MLKKQYLKNKPTCKVTFTLPVEAVNGAQEVKLLGEFNGWNREEGILMKATKKEFKTILELETGRNYEFRYLIDNNTWENDWAADGYIQTPFGVSNSVVTLETLDVPAKKTTTKAPAKKTASTAKKTTAKKATTTKKVTAKKATPAKTTKKAASTKDNLKKIEGIGPKIEKLLNEKDILTFGQLAKAKITVLKAVLADAGSRFKMHDPSTWAEQAKLAAKGEWDKLAILQDELKGGKRK